MHWIKTLCVGASGLALFAATGCASFPRDVHDRLTESTGAKVTDNSTAYSPRLDCLLLAAEEDRPRIAVGEVGDLTGRFSSLEGTVATQGAALMVVSALARAGFPLAERLDTRVAQLELEYANSRLIGPDGEPTEDYRRVLAGSIAGSDYMVLGGITELNFNLHSGVTEARIGPVVGGRRHYAMTVGLDLRLVDITDLRVINVVSQSKVIRGHEIRAGVFEFIGDTTLDIGVGERVQEPIHTAIRTIVESAVFDLVSGLAGPAAQTCSAAGTANSGTPAPIQTLNSGENS
ncbi:CsgG/HfaB family protein [Henriciella marina]|uniref:Transcriptional regulator n=1 Tax=Henriciella marina TaxID=453851 RepID=A0ABT4LV24_9PROT|nr:CsgG/HfaB family protein [Henriciella marina]MCZ4298190.1 transcriptional regulator [Henriciella marina]